MLSDREAIVVIAASSGGLGPLRQIVSALPARCAAAIFVVMHIGRHPSILPGILNGSGPLRADFARDGEVITGGRVYVAPPDRHMTLGPHRVSLNDGPKINNTRPAADPLFMSAARHYGPRVLGIVLSGGDSDGAKGLRAIRAQGGVSLVQEPATAQVPSMPQASIATDEPRALTIEEIARRIAALCESPRCS